MIITTISYKRILTLALFFILLTTPLMAQMAGDSTYNPWTGELDKTLDLSDIESTISDGITSLSNTYLYLDGSNANTDIDIGSYDLYADYLISDRDIRITGNYSLKWMDNDDDDTLAYINYGGDLQIRNISGDVIIQGDLVDLVSTPLTTLGTITAEQITSTDDITAGGTVTATTIAYETLDPPIDLSGYVPYSGATGDVDLGVYDFITSGDVSGTTGTFSSTVTGTNDNWDTAYTHSQDNTQAHSDYLLNNADDETSGQLTASSFYTEETGIGGYPISVTYNNYISKVNANNTTMLGVGEYNGFVHDLDYTAGGTGFGIVSGAAFKSTIDASGSIFGFNVKGLDFDINYGALQPSNPSNLVDVSSSKSDASFDDGAFKVSLTTSTTATAVAFKSTALNAGSGLTLGYRGWAQGLTGATGTIIGVEGYAVPVTTNYASVAIQGNPKPVGVLANDKKMSFRGVNGHILTNQVSSLIMTNTTDARPIDVSTDHLDFLNNGGEIYAIGNVEFDGTLYADGDVVVDGTATFNTTVQAGSYKSGDGTAGIDASCSTTITAITIKDGIITSITCP